MCFLDKDHPGNPVNKLQMSKKNFSEHFKVAFLVE